LSRRRATPPGGIELDIDEPIISRTAASSSPIQHTCRGQMLPPIHIFEAISGGTVSAPNGEALAQDTRQNLSSHWDGGITSASAGEATM
jgi:hypothetical protein